MEHCYINCFTKERILIVDLPNVVQTSQSKSLFRAGAIKLMLYLFLIVMIINDSF